MSPISSPNADAAPLQGRTRGPDILAGAALVAIALGLRLYRLGWGLQHLPDYDERIFVENALGMISRGDWDHRFYEYPGLLLWMLRGLLEVTGARRAEAYLVARGLVAASSTLTIGLVYAASERWVSRRAAFAAALFLALSPIDIETAHMLRPDSVIAPLLLLAMAFAVPKSGSQRSAAAVVVATIATAMKFSAAIVFVPLAVVIIMARERPMRIFAMATGAVLLFTALSPYTFLAGADSISGMRTQVNYHYGEAEAPGFFTMLSGFVTDTLARALSWPGLLLCGWGLVASERADRRRTLLWLSFPLLWLLVFSTSGARYGRFLVPILGALCVFLAMGIEDLLARSRSTASATRLAIAAGLLLSGTGTASYLSEIERTTMDRALAAVRALPDARFVGSSIVELGAMSADAPEITPLPGFRGRDGAATQFDALVLPAPAATPAGFTWVARIEPTSAHSGPALAVYRATARFDARALDLATATIRSSAPARDAQLRDGAVSTRWRSEGARGFMEIRFTAIATPCRLELDFGGSPPDHDYQIAITDDAGTLETLPLRPPIARQVGAAEFSAVIAWVGRPTRKLRIDIKGDPPLRVGELRVFEAVVR